MEKLELITDNYVSRKELIKVLKIHYHTVYNLVKNNKIETIQVGNISKYNLGKYILDNKKEIQKSTKKKICYCRVSSRKQEGDLERQIEIMKINYPEYEIITDIGSGLNLKRKGLDKIIDMSIKGEIEEVIVTYKDRLARFGYDLIEMILKKYSNAKITIINKSEKQTSDEELVKDIISTMNVYVAKINKIKSHHLDSIKKIDKKINIMNDNPTKINCSSFPKVIGITGKKFNGKDTLGNFFIEQHGYKRFAFADALKKGCSEIFGFTNEQLYGNQKEIVDEFFETSPRTVLQYIGTELFREQLEVIMPNIGKDIWIKVLEKKILDEWKVNPNTKIVITDIRFPNECKMVQNMGGIIIRVKRDCKNTSIDTHLSELMISHLPVNFEIANNSTKEEMFSNVLKQFYR